MSFTLNTTKLEDVSSKILREKHKFTVKYNGLSPSKVYLDPETYLILYYGWKQHGTNGIISNVDVVETVYGIKIEVVPNTKEMIEFGFKDNLETAMAFMYGR